MLEIDGFVNGIVSPGAQARLSVSYWGGLADSCVWKDGNLTVRECVIVTFDAN